MWSKNRFQALPDHRRPNNAPAPTHGAAGGRHTATPAPGSAARSRSAMVPCCAALIRNVLYRAGALSQMERDPTGMSQPVSPSAGCGSALPCTSPGRCSPGGADAAGSSSPGEREPGMRPQSSARAPAAALQHRSENKSRKNKRAFGGGQHAGRGCAGAAGPWRSVPGGSQCVPSRSPAPIPLLTQVEEESPLRRRACGTAALAPGSAACTVPVPACTAAFARRLWRRPGVRCLRAHGVMPRPSVRVSLRIAPCCSRTPPCTSACASAVPRGAAGCPWPSVPAVCPCALSPGVR